MVSQSGQEVTGAVHSAPVTGPHNARTISGITSDSVVVELTTSIDVLTKISDKYDSAADANQQDQSITRKEASVAMPKTRTRKQSSTYRVRIRGVRRARPDAAKIARAVIDLALAQAAREAEAAREVGLLRIQHTHDKKVA